MRFTFFVGAIMATSVLGLPALQERTPTDVLDEATKHLNKVKNVISIPREKRQVDLSGVTGLVGDLLDKVSGLLSTVLNTVTSLDGDVEVDIDIDSILTTVQGEITSIIIEVNSVIDGLDITNILSSVGDELNSTIAEVQTLLADIENIAGSVGSDDLLTDVEDLVQELLSTLVGLLNSVKA